VLLAAASATTSALPVHAAGDVARGAALVASRSLSLCTLCHAVPGQPAHLQGDIGPALAGVGARLSPAQLRQRLLQPEADNPETVMPAYGPPRDGLQQVAAAQRGQPLFSPAQIDDVVAYLASLR
jgi:sulfur-oxidizing protein SoxX